MIEIICNKDESDKNSHHVKEGVTGIRRPKNIKQIGDVSSDKKIYIEDYAFTYINSIAYNNPMIEQAGVLLGELQKDSEEKCVFVKGVIKSVVEDKGREYILMKMYGIEYIQIQRNIFQICRLWAGLQLCQI